MAAKSVVALAAGAAMLGAFLPVAARADLVPGVSLTPEVSVSTLGVGPELDARLDGLPLGLRVGGNFLSISRNVSSSDADYHGNADLSTGAVTADWYPFFGGFRLSGGIRLNGNKVTVDALPSAGGTVTLNHVAYSLAGSQIDGQVTFRDLAPYAGLGYGGELIGGLTLGFDLGAMFQGTPRSALSAQGVVTQLPGFAANLAAETQNLQNKVKDFTIYPVAELTVGWRF